MGEAKRRQEQGKAQPSGIKMTPRQRATILAVVHHHRFETQSDDGNVLAHNVFRVVDPETGKNLVEETPDGPKPVVLMSVPQPVRRALLSVVRV